MVAVKKQCGGFLWAASLKKLRESLLRSVVYYWDPQRPRNPAIPFMAAPIVVTGLLLGTDVIWPWFFGLPRWPVQGVEPLKIRAETIYKFMI